MAKSKTVGSRNRSTRFEENVRFLETVVQLRGDRPFIPKGVYRFKTHKEGQEWSLKMIARNSKRKADPQN